MEINILLKNPWVKSKNFKCQKFWDDLKLVLKVTTIALNVNVLYIYIHTYTYIYIYIDTHLQGIRLLCYRNKKEVKAGTDESLFLKTRNKYN